MGALGSIEGLLALTQCVADEEQWVREEAVIALYRVGAPEVVPALRLAQEDEDRHVRMYAAEALKRLMGGVIGPWRVLKSRTLTQRQKPLSCG